MAAPPSHFSSPPDGSGLSPSSLRGEALAYLASGLLRVGSVPGCLGAMWMSGEGGGGIDTAPGLFSLPFSAFPSLDLFRVGALGFLRAGRRPAAPAIPLASGGRSYLTGGQVGTSPGGGALAWLDADPEPAPGRSYRLASSCEEAASAGWLVDDGPALLPAPDDPLLPRAAWLCMDAYMASASERQPVGRPDRSMDPPSPTRLGAAGVSRMFDRAPDMTRAWVIGPSYALEGPSTFTVYVAEGCVGTTADPEVYNEMYADFLAAKDREGYSYMSPGEGHMKAVDDDVAFWSQWAPSGSVGRRRRWRTVRAEGSPGVWLDTSRTRADEEDVDWSAWLRLVMYGVDLGQPYNTERDPDGPPYWRPASGADVQARSDAFAVSYAGGEAPAYGEMPAVPSSGGYATPLSAGGVPVAAPDDVAVQLVYAATVTLVEEILGDAGTAARDGEPVDPGGGYPWGGGTFYRTRSWAVSGPVPGYGRWTRAAGDGAGRADCPGSTVFGGPSELVEFVIGDVLRSIDGVDPDDLLTGASSFSSATPPDDPYPTIGVYKGGEQVGGFPHRVQTLSGDAVVSALLVASVRLDAGGIFESGYCA